jgi:N6-L-threonylcarbamoyladenine synthase
VQKALAAIDGDLDRIRAIGVTRGPGLIGSLLVGVNTAQALGAAWDKKVVGVNHLRGHLRSPDLEEQRIEYPAVLLLVSGGHSVLSYMKTKGEIAVLGTTRDDSMGESYDKVARMLGLGMPGGPAIDKLAKLGSPVFKLPRPMIREGYEFSFSGLKSSIARMVDKDSEISKEDVAASFVAACMDIVEAKLRRALDEFAARSVVVVGGVAASPQLRQRVEDVCSDFGVRPCLPPLKWATDNAAMIALAAWDYDDAGINAGMKPNPNLALTDW